MGYCSDKGISHSEFLSWTPEDRAKTLAYLLEHAATCQLCGTAPWEWEENKFAYEPTEKYCHGCYLKSVTSEGAGSLPGTTVELTPVTAKLRAQQQLDRERAARLMADADAEAEE